MPVCRFIPLALLGLQVLATVPTHSPTPVCYEKKYKVHKADCITALSNIVYDNDGKLSHLGTQVAVAFESCVIAVYYSKDATVTRKKIDGTLETIFESCLSAGMSIIPDSNDAEIYITPRQTPRNWNTPYDPDYPFDKPYCFQSGGAIATKKEDCIEAYRQIPSDNQGRLIDPKTKAPSHSISFKYNTCRVSFYTTDESKVIAKSEENRDIVARMANQCGKQWGTVNIKGAEGPNGHTIITTRTY
ncbi:hypothetical protein Pst134EA_025603 [Puccinia striiformis f. sp. tritici]|uniref:hypothetical protein n=1 Tax=Puccinia striiformis f. sp. tritici TaxID=168172 RepID=UPI0020074BA4|nr:hypothetical protein Pst134EA_025603 [Puccinia striiformis f. sp. tritici]KAH9443833.1 hypothetical protein Pst134EB_026224 [Puccinia striiformis f. sp. tritici]KAH9451660.1 hypothetical protein Pst134EA_025603 [Puccinia striiformis f. sp. tritici]KAI9613132.1 hypothetical protein H4Q26_010410 [Puccinia striiformis f. sp. tritici PST-130]